MTAAADRPLIRILVVEDSPEDYALLRHQLRSAPFRVESRRVEEAQAMSEALRNESWDVVLSDHHLPRFSSAGALAQLRALNLDIPFIILSGVIGEDAAVDAMQAGADDYVMKSNMRRLVPAIERSLRMASERGAKRKAEAAALASERRFEAVTANIPGIVLRIEYDPARDSVRFPWVSQGAAMLYGYTSEALCRNPELLFACMEPADAAHLREAIAAAGHDQPLRWEGRIRAREDDLRWWLLAATADGSNPDVPAWDGILTDITPEKKALSDLEASRERLSALTAHLEALKEAERAEIAREIHDEMGGLLMGLKADAAWLKKNVEGRAREKVADIEALLDEVVLVSRRIAKSLRPAILDQGLGAALEWQAREFEKHSGIPCRFRTNRDDLALEARQATGVFRVFQEALTNVAKHAQASQVDVQVFATDGLVTLEVRDDGVGLRKQDLAKSGSFGVRGMQERVHHLGGWLDVSGAPGQGTTLMLSIPRDSQSPEARS